MNYFCRNGVFKIDDDGFIVDIEIEALDLAALQYLYGVLVEEFKDVYEGRKSINDYFEPLFDEAVWDSLKPQDANPHH